MTTSLSTAQIEQFQRDGFLFPLTVMDRRTAGEMRRGVEDLEQRFDQGSLKRPVANYLRSSPHLVSARIARLAMWPAILDAVEGIIGLDLLIWGSDLFIKDPGSPKIVSWHQDLTYWGLGATNSQVTAWLALSDVTKGAGCMRFVAGSHKNAIVPHNDTFAENNLLSRGQEIAVEVKEEDATDIILAPGQISLHHGLTFHASGPNTSNDRRIGMAIRFVTPEVQQQVAARDYGMLARGMDRTRNFINVAPPSSEFPTDAQERYEQIVADKAKALSEGAKGKIDEALAAR